jgi:hypothetical protein
MSNLIEEEDENNSEGNKDENEREQLKEENRDLVSALDVFTPTPQSPERVVDPETSTDQAQMENENGKSSLEFNLLLKEVKKAVTLGISQQK